jgi:DNA-binding transcriptional LysR family regulator
MQLKHLRTFLAVAGTLNLTRAGTRLNLAQSSVTEQIQALELDLGVTLFERARRRLALTPAGARLLDYARSILSLSDEARAAVAAEAATIGGRVVIGGIDSLCLDRLPALVLRYCGAFPEVQVVLRPGKTTELQGGLEAGTLDVYFTFGDGIAARGTQREALGREPIVLIAPPGHRLAGRARVTLAELADEPFLVTIEGCPVRGVFDRVFASGRRARPRVLGEFASIAAIRGQVEAGAACALVPGSAVREALARGTVAALRWAKPQHTAITMAWRRRRAEPPALARFLDVARHDLAA